jgi:hypothetical protein
MSLVEEEEEEFVMATKRLKSNKSVLQMISVARFNQQG